MTEVSREQVLETTLTALEESAAKAGTRLLEVTEDFDVLGSGIVDSLAFIGLLTTVEERLGVSIALDRLDFDRLERLGDLVEQLHALQERAGVADVAASA